MKVSVKIDGLDDDDDETPTELLAVLKRKDLNISSRTRKRQRQTNQNPRFQSSQPPPVLPLPRSDQVPPSSILNNGTFHNASTTMQQRHYPIPKPNQQQESDQIDEAEEKELELIRQLSGTVQLNVTAQTSSLELFDRLSKVGIKLDAETRQKLDQAWLDVSQSRLHAEKAQELLAQRTNAILDSKAERLERRRQALLAQVKFSS